MFFFFQKRRRFALRMAKAFPPELATDVQTVCNALASVKIASPEILLYGTKLLYSEEQAKWELLDGARVTLPYRVYISDGLRRDAKLTERQTLVYHTIFCASYDGYARQRHIEALLAAEHAEWITPFIVTACEDYVKEILESIYVRLKEKDLAPYKAFCVKNFARFRLGHSHMTNFYGIYHRLDCYRYKNYIGKRLYAECFGYRKSGQKFIQQ